MDAGSPLHMTVICPVRNGGTAFSETLRCLARIDDPSISLLISDNFSTDDRPWEAELAELRGWDWKIIQPPHDMGRIEHWNWLFAMAEGDLIKPLLVGDTIDPGYPAAVRACFAADPDLSLAFTQATTLEGSSETRPSPELDITRLTHETYLERCLDIFNVFGPMSAITFARDPLRRCLPFSPDHPWNADWRLYVACLHQGPAGFVPRPMARLNRQIARFSSSGKTVLPAAREDWQFLDVLSRRSPSASWAKLWQARFRLVIWHAAIRLGRAYLPRAIRRPLGWALRQYLNLRRRTGQL